MISREMTAVQKVHILIKLNLLSVVEGSLILHTKAVNKLLVIMISKHNQMLPTIPKKVQLSTEWIEQT